MTGLIGIAWISSGGRNEDERGWKGEDVRCGDTCKEPGSISIPVAVANAVSAGNMTHFMGMGTNLNTAVPSPPLTSSPLPSGDVFLGETPRVMRVSGLGSGAETREASNATMNGSANAKKDVNANAGKDDGDGGGGGGKLGHGHGIPPSPHFCICLRSRRRALKSRNVLLGRN